MRYFLIGFTTALLFYLIASFIKWDLNPSNWDEGYRAFVSIWVLAVVAFTSISYATVRS